MRKMLFACALLMQVSLLALADTVQTVYISCKSYEGYVGLGTFHSVSPYIYYCSESEPSEDCYWTMTQTSKGYTFQNAVTGQYLVYTTERVNQYYKYMTLANNVSDNTGYWEMEDLGEGYYAIKSVDTPTAYWNLRTDGTGLLGTYEGSSRSDNEYFYIHTSLSAKETLQQYVDNTFPSGVSATTFPYGTDEGLYSEDSYATLLAAYNQAVAALSASEADETYVSLLNALKSALAGLKVNAESLTFPASLHVYLSDGRIQAFPLSYVASREESGGQLTITTNVGITKTYKMSEVDSVSTVAPTDFPKFRTYKFNNKYNDQVFTDCVGTISDNKVSVDVGAIGKRLTASFNLTSDIASAYVSGVEQVSKESRIRFDGDVIYLLANHGTTILSATKQTEAVYAADGKTIVTPATYTYSMKPYGRKVVVSVNWLTDNNDVPKIYINTADGLSITSKTEYKEATISIDGNGVYPSMPETAVQIKGRGNSSWSYSKKPYLLKFASKQKPFGMTKGKSWVLLANAQNRSMTTNAVGHKIANLVGAVSANHIVPVDLYLNGTYLGNYNFTEKVGFSNNSVDLDDESAAAFLELDSYYDEPYKFQSSLWSVPVNIKEPDYTDSETTTLISFSDIQNSFNEMEELVYYGEDISNVVDMEMCARFLIANEIMGNTELSHPKSCFLYREDYGNDDSKYIFGPVWDCDWAFGYEGTGYYYVINDTSDFWTQLSSGRPGTNFFNGLRRNDAISKYYYMVWTEFMNNGLEELVEFCQDYYDYAAASMNRNSSIWGTVGDYSTINDNAKNWLRSRANYVYGNLAAVDYSDLIDKGIEVGDVNEDGAITAADVVCVVNNILEKENDTFNFKQADADGNEIITMADAVKITSLVLSQPVSSVRHRLRLLQADAALQLKQTALQAEGEALMPLLLNVEESNYTALQFDLTLPAGFRLASLELPTTLSRHHATLSELGDHQYRVIVLSSGNETIPVQTLQMELALVSEGEANALGGMVSVSNALLSNALGVDFRLNATSVRLVSAETTGVNKTNVGNGTPASVYDLQGRRVQNASKQKAGQRGVYIVNGKKMVK